MKILLINPPYVRFKNIENTYFPLGLGYLASVANQAGHETYIYNSEIPSPKEKAREGKFEKQLNDIEAANILKRRIYDYGDPIWREIRSVIGKERPNLIGIGTRTVTLGVTKRIAELAKNIDKDIKVVIGGSHASVDPCSCFTENVDFVLMGEGETSIRDLLSYIEGKKPVEEVKNILYRKNGAMIKNASAPLVSDIDIIPIPNRKALLNVHGYSRSVISSFMTDLIGSRGCPFSCKFCSVKNVWGKSVRHRKPERVVEEMQEVHREFGTTEFHMWDDTFTLNKEHFLKFCDLLIGKKSPFLWSCSTRVDFLNYDILKKMKRAGCFTVFIGVESGSEKTLAYIAKEISLKKVIEAQTNLRKAKIAWKTYFIVGFPDETKKDIDDTFSFMKTLKPTRFYLNVFTPYPGTELYERCKELKLTQGVDWDLVETKGSKYNFVNSIDKKEFSDLLKEMSGFVDEYNKRSETLCRKIMERLDYIKNPIRFSKRILRYIMKRMALGWRLM